MGVLSVDYSMSTRDLTVQEIFCIYLPIYLSIYLSWRHLRYKYCPTVSPWLLECLQICCMPGVLHNSSWGTPGGSRG